MSLLQQTDRIRDFSELMLATNHIHTWEYMPEKGLQYSNSQDGLFWDTYLHDNSVASLLDAWDSPDMYPLFFSDASNVSWIAQPYKSDSGKLFFLLGPVFSSGIDSAAVVSSLSFLYHKQFKRADLERIIETMPVVSSTNLFQYAVMFHYLAHGSVCKINDIHLSISSSPAEDAKSPGTSYMAALGSYTYEQHFLKLVEDGNLNYQTLLNNNSRLGQIGTLSPDSPLRQTKDLCLSTIILVSRAAIRGGLDPYAAYSLSDHYVQRIEKARTIADAYAVVQDGVDDYVHRVHFCRVNRTSFSKEILAGISYMQLHLTEDVSLEAIASSLGYNTYYYSRRFKKETGQTIADYLTDLRLEYAKTALRSTNISVQQLSEQLQFASPSYFIKKFREHTGVTPNEYRNQ